MRTWVDMLAYTPGAGIFAGFLCPAKNLSRFCCPEGPFYGYFTNVRCTGRTRSFSARKDPSYYAAAGRASRANVSR